MNVFEMRGQRIDKFRRRTFTVFGRQSRKSTFCVGT
jgi:hypothetical protein